MNRLTDIQEFKIIWKQCANIAGMSPKYFKNINHPEQEIRMNNVSGHGQMNEGQTQPLLELTPRGD